jgi:hypothetical protein
LCTGQRCQQGYRFAVVPAVRVAKPVLHVIRGVVGQGAHQLRAVHADAAVDVPGRDCYAFGIKGALPGIDVQVVGINQGSVYVKQDREGTNGFQRTPPESATGRLRF